MNKTGLETFISKYNLGGACEQVIWSSDGSTLSTRGFVESKDLVISVTYPNSGFPEGKYAIFETKRLKSILGVMDNDIAVTPNEDNGRMLSLKIASGKTKATFVLADPMVFSTIPTVDAPALPPIEIELNEEIINTFVRAKNALSDASTFAVTTSGNPNSVLFVINHSSNNVNNISLEVEATPHDEFEPVNFSAYHMRDILFANREFGEGKIKFWTKGLMEIAFDDPFYKAHYHLVYSNV